MNIMHWLLTHVVMLELGSLELSVPWGHTLTVVGVMLGGLRYIGSRLKAMHEDFLMVSVEHETLMHDYCERKGIRLDEFPTRSMENKGRAFAAWNH